MNYPSLLVPNDIEKIHLNDRTLSIPKKTATFKKWHGSKLKNTFGNKPLIDFNGTPMFVEIAILKLGIISSWNGRWVETYAMKKNSPYYFMDWIDDDLVNQKSIEVQETRIREIIESIKTEHRGFSGFWDIMLWDKDNIVFYECKRKNKDKISPTQINWIESALKTGLKETNFVIFEWSL